MRGIGVASAKEVALVGLLVLEVEYDCATHPTSVFVHIKHEFTVNQRIAQGHLGVVVMRKVEPFLTTIGIVAVDLSDNSEAIGTIP
jgi:uncharacterized membrane protein